MPRYRLEPRRPARTAAWDWSLPERELRSALAGLAPGGRVLLPLAFEGGAAAVTAAGLHWRLSLAVSHGSANAQLCLHAELPEALGLHEGPGGAPPVVASVEAHVAVARWKANGSAGKGLLLGEAPCKCGRWRLRLG